MGPWRAHQIRSGDPFELSEGQALYSPRPEDEIVRARASAALVIDTDPDVDGAAIDAGFTPADGTLRAPDIAVGVPNKSGWVPGAPPLAIEYASVGQDEGALQKKIDELLAAGTQLIWVVRLIGPRRVEVFAPDAPVRVFGGSDALHAPGILRKPVPVAALYDREVAHERAFENLLERHGYTSLDEVREEGMRTTLVEILGQRFGPLPEARLAALAKADATALRALTRRALSAPDLDAVFAG